MSVDEYALAKAIYDLDPFVEGGEYIDGFRVSPGGPLSWEQACARDAEFADDPVMVPLAKFARDAAKAVIAVAAKTPIEVTTQMLLDVGLNAFGLVLFAESIAGKKDVRTFTPITFRYKGVRCTIAPDPESHPMNRGAEKVEAVRIDVIKNPEAET